MEDKKTQVKESIKEFAIKYAAPVSIVIVSYTVGFNLATRIYKKGFDDGHDALANAIYSASQTGGGILLSNKKVGDVIFKATKELKD